MLKQSKYIPELVVELIVIDSKPELTLEQKVILMNQKVDKLYNRRINKHWNKK